MKSEKFAHGTKKNCASEIAVSTDIQIEKNRWRMEERKVSVYTNLTNIDQNDWYGIQSLIQINRTVESKWKRRYEEAFYISSLDPHKITAKEFSNGIRSHWSIENSLHYVKDVTFKEDLSKIRTKYAPKNKSIIINIILKVLRKHGYQNIAQALRMLANDIPLMRRLLLE